MTSKRPAEDKCDEGAPLKKAKLSWQDLDAERKQLTRVTCVPLAEVWHASHLFPPSQLEEWLVALRAQVTELFKPTYVTVFNNTYEERRRVLGFGDQCLIYNYSGRRVKPTPWEAAPIMDELRQAVFAQVEKVLPGVGLPNFCLLNWYRDGTDKLGAHSDDETDLVNDKPIVSFSLGSGRRFVFHDKPKGRKVGEVMLNAGALVIMGQNCQKQYKHSVPEMKKVKGDRWSLTFRWIVEPII